MIMKKIALAFLLSSVLISSLMSQWKEITGPETGTVSGIVATDSLLFASTNKWVYQSTDKGNTWRQIKNGFAYDVTNAITNKGAIIIAGSNGGLYRSTNYGESWVRNEAELKASAVYAFAWDADTLYAAGSEGIFKSIDAGNKWTNTRGDLPTSLVRGVSVVNGTVYTYYDYGTLYRSTDKGATWKNSATNLDYRQVYSVIQCDSSLYALTNAGIYRCVPPDYSWQLTDSAYNMVSFYAAERSGDTLYCGTSAGLLASTTQGKSWKTIFKRAYRPAVGSMKKNGNIIYAGTYGKGLFRSLDGGASWSKTGTLVSIAQISGFCANKMSLLAADQSGGIYCSSDNGATWGDLSADSLESVTFVAIRDSILFASNYSGCFRRSLADSAWSRLNSPASVNQFAIRGDSMYVAAFSGLFILNMKTGVLTKPDTVQLGGEVYCCYASGNIALAHSRGTQYVSLDYGKTWLPRPGSVPIDWMAQYGSIDTLFFAVSQYGLFSTTPRDTLWRMMSGPKSNKWMSCIAIAGNLIIAGMNPGGVYYSTDRGATWSQDFVISTESLPVNGITLNDRYMFCGGWYGSMYRRAVYPSMGVAATKSAVPAGAPVLQQNYPNPFNPSTTIRFSVPVRSMVVLTIYNVLGQRVQQLANRQMEAGYGEIVWNADVPSGLYICRMESSAVDKSVVVSARKMLLLR